MSGVGVLQREEYRVSAIPRPGWTSRFHTSRLACLIAIFMPIARQEISEFGPDAFNNFDFECNYGSPPAGTFDSQGWDPAVPNAAKDGSQDPCDTVEDIRVAPAAFWNDHLQNELLDVVTEKAPEPQYKPDETKITVPTSKRAQRCLEKRFRALNIDWSPVENKLRSWSDQGSNLTVEVWFIHKEVQIDSTNKVGKTGRGATKQQLAARDKLVAQQEASGVRPVWKDVYALFECSSVVCPNRGFSCWRDPETKSHRKLDSDIMDKLIDFAEEGHKLETHGDVPDRIREVSMKKRRQNGKGRSERHLIRYKASFVFAATGLMMAAATIQMRIHQKSLAWLGQMFSGSPCLWIRHPSYSASGSATR